MISIFASQDNILLPASRLCGRFIGSQGRLAVLTWSRFPLVFAENSICRPIFHTLFYRSKQRAWCDLLRVLVRGTGLRL